VPLCPAVAVDTEEDEMMGLDVSKHGERAIAVEAVADASMVINNGAMHQRKTAAPAMGVEAA
jgi:hypothetical protein